jgi:hypothetical protein
MDLRAARSGGGASHPRLCVDTKNYSQAFGLPGKWEDRYKTKHVYRGLCPGNDKIRVSSARIAAEAEFNGPRYLLFR